jgi:PadR family transcriptional regulator, regulatory protein PadR
MPQRITRQLRAVLEVLMQDPAAELYGLDLLDATKLRSGTLYPLLHRLVSDGWLERSGPVASSGAPRYFYKLTGVGARAAAEILSPSASKTSVRDRHPVPRHGVQPA